jgi:hypothetical protein
MLSAPVVRPGAPLRQPFSDIENVFKFSTFATKNATPTPSEKMAFLPPAKKGFSAAPK